MTTRQLRLIRAAAVSGIATLIAAVSHTLGGGTAPHPLLILATTVLFLPFSALMLGLRRSRVRVAAAVVLSQGAFHTAFQLLGAPGAGAPGAGGPSAVGPSAVGPHAHHLDLAALSAPGSVAAPDPTMLAAHLVAAVLTAALIWHGESAVRTIAGWFQRLFRRAVGCAPSPDRRPVALRSLLSPSCDRAFSAAVSRRGPPVLLGG